MLTPNKSTIGIYKLELNSDSQQWTDNKAKAGQTMYTEIHAFANDALRAPYTFKTGINGFFTGCDRL